MDPTLALVLLPVVALVAGFIDAIAGGGGLLTVPALLFAVPDARVALGTNKGQSVWGALAALVAFAREGKVDRARAAPTFVGALAGAVLGARLVVMLRPASVRPVVLVLLVAVALFVGARELVSARAARAARAAGSRSTERAVAPGGLASARRHPLAWAAGVGALLGVYDGFFGPGTGTFLIVAFTLVFGETMDLATANAKVANFASNLGSVVTFALAGTIDLRLAAPMAIAQLVGGALGAKAALRGGERVVRLAVLGVTLALVARLVWQMLA